MIGPHIQHYFPVMRLGLLIYFPSISVRPGKNITQNASFMALRDIVYC